MGRYTVYNEKWIDEQIQSHIDLAVDQINERIQDVESIILVGGFGRAEGSVKLQDEKMTPLNDYDIYVVLGGNKKVSEKNARELMDEIERKVGTCGFSLYESSKKDFYFDIRFLNIDKLKKLPPFIKYYEMKHSSYILGGGDVRGQIPDYQPLDLPISEGFRFVMNRLSSISLWTPTDLIREQDIPQWKKDVILYDVSKSYIEICTVLSQMAEVYVPTYQGRAGNLKKVLSVKFPELVKKIPDLMKKIEYYTNLKLKPEYGGINDHLYRWFDCRDDLLVIVQLVLEKVFRADFNNFTKKTSAQYFRPYLQAKFGRYFLSFLNFAAQLYLTLIWFWRVVKFRKKIYWPILLNWHDPGLKIFNSLIYISGSLQKDGQIDLDKLRLGVKILKRAYPLKVELMADLDNFDKIMEGYINAWKLYYFQNIG